MGLLSAAFGAIKAAAFFIGKRIIQTARVVVGGFIGEVFDNALGMMRNVMDKLVGRVVGTLEGSSHFFRNTGDRFQEGTKNYSVDEEIGEWNETIVTRNVERESLPDEYMPHLNVGYELNDTKELYNSLETE